MTDISTHSTHLPVPLRARTLSRHTGDACYACCGRSANTIEDILRAEITAICQQIDRRNGTTPGTAEKAVYFWFWPRSDEIDTLTALHADAVEFLHKAVSR